MRISFLYEFIIIIACYSLLDGKIDGVAICISLSVLGTTFSISGVEIEPFL